MSATLAKQVVSIVEEFLGPASQRYVDRLITYHLKKEPEMLTISDLPKLANWVKVSLGLMTDDKVLVDKCEKRLLALKSA